MKVHNYYFIKIRNAAQNNKCKKKLNIENLKDKDNFDFKEYFFFAVARAFFIATSITEVRLS